MSGRKSVPCISPELDPLLAIAAAVLNENGELMEANAGFARLVRYRTLQGPIRTTWLASSFSQVSPRSSVPARVPMGWFTMGC